METVDKYGNILMVGDVVSFEPKDMTYCIPHKFKIEHIDSCGWVWGSGVANPYFVCEITGIESRNHHNNIICVKELKLTTYSGNILVHKLT